ncbi:MAG TPA: hypothetical protein VLX92_28650 [Kofleriaceae bacterium]|nr:hypothetical protein [Kofleriaceae bacterium]
MFRLVTAAADEVCINGEVRMAPDAVEGATFVLKSFRTPNDRDETAPGVDSRPAKVLDSGVITAENNHEDRRDQTSFQVCFPNQGILTGQTAYLVVRGKSVAPGLFAVWHFDDDVRY